MNMFTTPTNASQTREEEEGRKGGEEEQEGCVESATHKNVLTLEKMGENRERQLRWGGNAYTSERKMRVIAHGFLASGDLFEAAYMGTERGSTESKPSPSLPRPPCKGCICVHGEREGWSGREAPRTSPHAHVPNNPRMPRSRGHKGLSFHLPYAFSPGAVVESSPSTHVTRLCPAPSTPPIPHLFQPLAPQSILLPPRPALEGCGWQADRGLERAVDNNESSPP